MTLLFGDLRRHSAALADALARAEHAQGGVARQLQSTTGYAEDQTVQLRRSEAERQRAERAYAETNDALENAQRHIAGLQQQLVRPRSENIRRKLQTIRLVRNPTLVH